MNDFQNNEVVSSRSGLSEFYAKIYAIMGMGVAVSAVTAFVINEYFIEGLARLLSSLPFGFMLLWIVQIGLVLYLGRKAFSNPKAAMIGFLLYSFLNGITISFTLAVYGVETMSQAFFAAAGTFGAMAIVGKTTKKDLSAMGRAMRIALFGVIISIIVNMFMQNSMFDLFISFATVFIFAGLTAYDHQMIKNYYDQAQGDAKSLSGIAVFCALQLYLDFINLLLAFVRIFGRD